MTGSSFQVQCRTHGYLQRTCGFPIGRYCNKVVVAKSISNHYSIIDPRQSKCIRACRIIADLRPGTWCVPVTGTVAIKHGNSAKSYRCTCSIIAIDDIYAGEKNISVNFINLGYCSTHPGVWIKNTRYIGIDLCSNICCNIFKGVRNGSGLNACN